MSSANPCTNTIVGFGFSASSSDLSGFFRVNHRRIEGSGCVSGSGGAGTRGLTISTCRSVPSAAVTVNSSSNG